MAKKISKKKWIVIAIITLIFVGLIAASSDKQNTPTQPPASKSQETVTQAAFDVPTLIGKNIDEVRVSLGAPADGNLSEPNQQQKELGVKEWNNTFKKGDKELLVTFNWQTREIIDFFIGTDDPSGKTQDKKSLLEIGNLKEDDSLYKIEFVKAAIDPSSYTGVKAIPR